MRSAGRRRRPVPRFRSCAPAVGVFLSALLLSACSSPHRYIDSAGAATRIRDRIQHDYHPSEVSVTCPAGVADRVGERFTCDAQVDGQALTIDATVTSSKGSISVQPRQAVIVPAAVASSLASQIEHRAGQRPVVSCPSRPTLVVAPGGTFTCSAVFSGQAPRTVTVKVLDAKGDFSFVLAPAA